MSAIIYPTDPLPQASYSNLIAGAYTTDKAVRLGFWESFERNGDEVLEDAEECGVTIDPDQALPFPPEEAELCDWHDEEILFATKAKAIRWLEVALEQVKALPDA